MQNNVQDDQRCCDNTMQVVGLSSLVCCIGFVYLCITVTSTMYVNSKDVIKKDPALILVPIVFGILSLCYCGAICCVCCRIYKDEENERERIRRQPTQREIDEENFRRAELAFYAKNDSPTKNRTTFINKYVRNKCQEVDILSGSNDNKKSFNLLTERNNNERSALDRGNDKDKFNSAEINTIAKQNAERLTPQSAEYRLYSIEEEKKTPTATPSPRQLRRRAIFNKNVVVPICDSATYDDNEIDNTYNNILPYSQQQLNKKIEITGSNYLERVTMKIKAGERNNIQDRYHNNRYYHRCVHSLVAQLCEKA